MFRFKITTESDCSDNIKATNPFTFKYKNEQRINQKFFKNKKEWTFPKRWREIWFLLFIPLSFFSFFLSFDLLDRFLAGAAWRQDTGERILACSTRTIENCLNHSLCIGHTRCTPTERRYMERGVPWYHSLHSLPTSADIVDKSWTICYSAQVIEYRSQICKTKNKHE